MKSKPFMERRENKITITCKDKKEADKAEIELLKKMCDIKDIK